MKLKEPIYDIEPVALNSSPIIPVVHQELIAMGFGNTEYQGNTADELQEGQFRYISKETCIERFMGIEGLDFQEDDYLCVDPEETSSVCNGDSGGPLVTKSTGEQVGVSSFTVRCEDDEIPDGFARVSFFYGWIQKMICEISSMPPADCQDGEPNNSSRDPNEVDLRLVFNFDWDAHEITFAIRNKVTGLIEYAGPHFVAFQGSTQESFLSLLPGEYTMEVYDTLGGNGLRCPDPTGLSCIWYPDGSWNLHATYPDRDAEVEIASGNAYFQYLQTTDFGIEGHSNPDQSSPSESSNKPSDDCPLATAIPIDFDATGIVSILGSTSGATAALPDFDYGCSEGREAPIIWYQLDADVDASITITTCSENTKFDTTITVFLGDSESNCTAVCSERNDDHGSITQQCAGNPLHSFLDRISIVAGQKYYIAIGGFSANDSGQFELQLAPSHDNLPRTCPLDSATTLVYDGSVVTVASTTAGEEPTLPDSSRGCPVNRNSPTKWFLLQSSVDSTIGITTCSEDTEFDTVVTVFQAGSEGGCSVSCINYNDDHASNLGQCDGDPFHSLTTVSVTSGENYYIAVTGFNPSDSGNFVLRLWL